MASFKSIVVVEDFVSRFLCKTKPEVETLPLTSLQHDFSFSLILARENNGFVSITFRCLTPNVRFKSINAKVALISKSALDIKPLLFDGTDVCNKRLILEKTLFDCTSDMLFGNDIKLFVEISASLIK